MAEEEMQEDEYLFEGEPSEEEEVTLETGWKRWGGNGVGPR